MTGKTKARQAPSRNTFDEIGVEALADMILEGKSYRQIAADCGSSLGALNRWISSDPDRSHALACARKVASQTFDEMAVEVVKSANDMFELTKAKELAAHYRWRAKCADPSRYGDKVQSEITGANGGPLDMSLNVTFVTPRVAGDR